MKFYTYLNSLLEAFTIIQWKFIGISPILREWQFKNEKTLPMTWLFLSLARSVFSLIQLLRFNRLTYALHTADVFCSLFFICLMPRSPPWLYSIRKCANDTKKDQRMNTKTHTHACQFCILIALDEVLIAKIRTKKNDPSSVKLMHTWSVCDYIAVWSSACILSNDLEYTHWPWTTSVQFKSFSL